MKPTLVVLAAGMGSRYGGLKQLDGVGPKDETVMDYSIYDAIRAGFGKVVFVIRKDIEQQFQSMVQSKYEKKILVEYVFQELHNVPENHNVPQKRHKPWGTGQALLCASTVVDEPFAVINADDFYGAESYQLLADFLKRGSLAGDNDFCMCGFLLKNTLSENGAVARGICRITNDKLTSVTELTEIERYEGGVRNRSSKSEFALSGQEVVSMNMWGFTPKIFPQLASLFADFLDNEANLAASEFYIPAAVDALIKSGQAQVEVLRSSDNWFGVTYHKDRDEVVNKIKRLVALGCYPSPLF